MHATQRLLVQNGVVVPMQSVLARHCTHEDVFGLHLGACAVHCRYCFRRHYPYDETPRSVADWQPALEELAADTSLHEAILSGGDPLTLVDETLSELIEALAAHAVQDRFVYYHSWRVGDLLIWDERATMHRGAGDYRPDERRVMLRTIVYPN